MINAIIIDDEKKSRETLNAMLNRHCPAVNVLAQADGVRTGLEAIENYQPDVVFLDIQMLDGSGFKLLQKVGNINFEIIFVTAFDQYAIKAIKYSALDYLLKPIISRDLILAVKKVETKMTRSLKDARIRVLLENIKSTEIHPHKIILSTIEKIHVIEIGDIIRCESDNYYTKFFFTDGTTLLISKTLKENEEMLRDHNFIRPHKSHLVNLFYVKSFIKHDGGYIVLTDGSKVPVSRRKREKVVEIINNL